MNKQEIELKLQEIKQMLIPPTATLELVALEGTDLKLKVTGLPEDIFKVQGKIINSGDEIKKKIAEKLEESFKGLKVSFM